MADQQRAKGTEELVGRLLIVGVVAGVAIGVVAGVINVITSSIGLLTTSVGTIGSTAAFREAGLYVASWIILLGISWLAGVQVREVLLSHPDDPYRTRANYIAVIIGLVLTIFLFKQPLLERIFAGQTSGGLLKTFLFGGGLATGWLVWYLRHLRKYGEFFHVLLFTVIIGFCWYARLTGPEEVQITAVAFLLGSLVRLAKDYLDAASVSHAQEKIAM